MSRRTKLVDEFKQHTVTIQNQCPTYSWCYMRTMDGHEGNACGGYPGMLSSFQVLMKPGRGTTLVGCHAQNWVPIHA
ncbi:hypothetical protein [Dyadobacter sp. NIV53]|uniref:hypothetical protein n=1 Tax=Dyadobacter sp. NIV53 TaxID=2861765 RepID=UPI001C87D6ED|nr:hypothetical protein [Dyadobacter sp. NIV53]